MFSKLIHVTKLFLLILSLNHHSYLSMRTVFGQENTYFNKLQKNKYFNMLIRIVGRKKITKQKANKQKFKYVSI